MEGKNLSIGDKAARAGPGGIIKAVPMPRTSKFKPFTTAL
jgi:hypothetical protein